MPRTIIIGLDNGEQGRDALVLGALIAETLAATPVVATALPYPADQIGTRAADAMLRQESAPLFAAAREQLGMLHPETRAIASRSPAEALYEIAEERAAVAIVVGSTHRGPLGRVYPGSVGANLLHGAPCAVAVAPRGYASRAERHLLRLMVAFDGSAEAWTALETGIGLAQRLHGALTLLTVVEPPGYGWGEALSVLSPGEIHTRDQNEKKEVLDLGLARVPEELPVEGRLMNGEVADAIANASEDFDLLLLGSRGYGPLRRTLMGSAAAEAMRRAECPVLALPRAAGVDPFALRDAPGKAESRRASAAHRVP